ncbi:MULTISPECIES: WXG100 family type VII secretion target [unclassified Streptomyces]|uniref:WXG100 family type VII secretion target n=1 Tax=unclassified Streptomyces TaxID=2593676 RepID=UPI00036A68B0|nr:MULTISPECIES: WXG100 family type VII secretion target [unclassified Streptomyces]EYT82000.1 hypothetical protein CF54_15960 [Streptomyces sp. Tu 6176]
MSDSGISIDHLQAGQSAQAMMEETGRIQAIVTELQQQMETVVNDWIGPDRDVYKQKVLPTWNAEVAALSQILTRFSTTLNDVSDNYKRTVQTNAENFLDIRM